MQHCWKYVSVVQIISTQSSSKSRHILYKEQGDTPQTRGTTRRSHITNTFLVLLNDLIEKCPSPVKCAMYADDLVLWNTEECATTAKIQLQEAINILSSWAQDWRVKINNTKSFTTLFTLSTKSKSMKIMLDDTELQHTDRATYL